MARIKDNLSVVAPTWSQAKSVIDLHLERIYEFTHSPITDELLKRVNSSRQEFLERLVQDNLMALFQSTTLSPIEWLFRFDVEEVMFAYNYLISALTGAECQSVDVYGEYSSKYSINGITSIIQLDTSAKDKFFSIIEKK